jgi:ribosome-binding protein aMBF1 (putative translation factor)
MGQESGKRPKFDLDSRSASSPPPGALDEHQAFNTVVGEGIRKARQEHGWTQAHLADQARLSPNYIARLERGELGPSLFVANRICEALAIPLEELVAPLSSSSSSSGSNGSNGSSGHGRKTTAKRRATG